MNEAWNEKGFTLREASEHDISQLSIHHRMMFEEIWAKRGLRFGDSVATEIEQAYSRKLREDFAAGFCKSWLIEKGSQVVASGAITIVSLVPTPNDLSSRVAYLHSMYTETGQRGKNLASRIVKTALEYCKANKIKRIILNASDAGRPIYERIGFTSSPEMMRFFVEANERSHAMGDKGGKKDKNKEKKQKVTKKEQEQKKKKDKQPKRTS